MGRLYAKRCVCVRAFSACRRSYLRGRRSRRAARRRAWRRGRGASRLHLRSSRARFARWGVFLGVVGRGSLLVLCAHAHAHRPPLLHVSGGAASVLSCRASRACLRACAEWGYARAALCGPLVPSRPPGDLKNTKNLHQITLGPPPVTLGLRGAGFQSSFKNH